MHDSKVVKKHIHIAVLILCSIALSAVSVACQPLNTTTANDVLNLFGEEPITLDPAVSGEMTSHGYITQLFSGLVCLDDELQIKPDIAERWELSDDGLTYTFFLRDGVYFHDGRAVTAEDFKYSWERACSQDTGSQTAAIYLGDIYGVEDVLSGRTKQILGVKVLDEYILEVTLCSPKAYFLCKLTYPTTFVVDRENVAMGRGWWQNPSGTGPFVLKDWIPGNELILERNELYYAGLPKLKQVVFHLLAGVPMVLYENGDVDVTPVFLNYIDLISDQKSEFHEELVVVPELSLHYIGFNVAEEPFDDMKVRQAFSHAVNKERIIEIIVRDMVVEANSIIPPGMPDYAAELDILDYDVDTANKLIEESKYGTAEKLPPITLTVTGYGNSIADYLGAILEDWRENLGVDVTVRQLEPEAFFYNYKEESDEMFMLGWVADYPDPDNFLETLFYSNSENNAFNYNNPVVDMQLNAAAAELDEAVRLDMYQEVERQLVEEAICLPFSFGMNAMLVKPYVKDFTFNPLGIPDLKNAYIEQE